MRHHTSQRVFVVAVVILAACVVSTSTSSGQSRVIGRKILLPATPTPAPAPVAPSTGTSRCNSATLPRFRRAAPQVRGAGESATSIRIPYILYPLARAPRLYPYRPTYYPRYQPSYLPLAEQEEAHRVTIRPSSYEDKQRSRKLVGEGDASFARRSYVSAAARYQEAIRVAPDAADAYPRAALALVARRKYPAAANSMLAAFDAQANWFDAPPLGSLYAPGELEKTTSRLQRLVDSNPMNAQFALALGVQLFFTGDREQAQLYLNRAEQLGIDKQGRLAGFRPPDETEPAAD